MQIGLRAEFDYTQLRHRFDLQDTPMATKQKLHTNRQKEDEGLDVFCRELCPSGTRKTIKLGGC